MWNFVFFIYHENAWYLFIWKKESQVFFNNPTKKIIKPHKKNLCFPKKTWNKIFNQVSPSTKNQKSNISNNGVKLHKNNFDVCCLILTGMEKVWLVAYESGNKGMKVVSACGLHKFLNIYFENFFEILIPILQKFVLLLRQIECFGLV